jgi:hypothetical protein
MLYDAVESEVPVVGNSPGWRRTEYKNGCLQYLLTLKLLITSSFQTFANFQSVAMLAAFSALLVATTLVSATPMQRRTAAVIPLPARSGHHTGTNKVFNPEAIRLERARIAQKYTSGKLRKAANQEEKRVPVDHEAYDIQKRATSGHDPLVDVFDTIDESGHIHDRSTTAC